MTKPQKTAYIGVRVLPELRAALARAADGDRRTLTNLVEKILTEWVEEGRAQPSP